MTILQKVMLRGIRAYNPSTKSYIEFQTPLTIIQGTNGSGKTTIIESLKYVTTGEFPLNTKGGAFVYDPKIIDACDVKGQIKLQFKNVNGDIIVVTRSLQSTVKANGSLTQRSIESTILIKKTENEILCDQNVTGKNFKNSRVGLQSVQDKKSEYSCDVGTSNRCANINLEVQDHLGISPSILEYVTFCHQEESNWMLSDPASVKKKLDEIFATTKYSKAIENTKNLRKFTKDIFDKGRLELGYLLEKKMKKDKLLKEIEEEYERNGVLNERISFIKDEIDGLKLDELIEAIKNEEYVENKYRRYEMEIENLKVFGVSKILEVDDLRSEIQKIKIKVHETTKYFVNGSQCHNNFTKNFEIPDYNANINMDAITVKENSLLNKNNLYNKKEKDNQKIIKLEDPSNNDCEIVYNDINQNKRFKISLKENKTIHDNSKYDDNLDQLFIDSSKMNIDSSFFDFTCPGFILNDADIFIEFRKIDFIKYFSYLESDLKKFKEIEDNLTKNYDFFASKKSLFLNLTQNLDNYTSIKNNFMQLEIEIKEKFSEFEISNINEESLSALIESRKTDFLKYKEVRNIEKNNLKSNLESKNKNHLNLIDKKEGYMINKKVNLEKILGIKTQIEKIKLNSISELKEDFLDEIIVYDEQKLLMLLEEKDILEIEIDEKQNKLNDIYQNQSESIALNEKKNRKIILKDEVNCLKLDLKKEMDKIESIFDFYEINSDNSLRKEYQNILQTINFVKNESIENYKDNTKKDLSLEKKDEKKDYNGFNNAKKDKTHAYRNLKDNATKKYKVEKGYNLLVDKNNEFEENKLDTYSSSDSFLDFSDDQADEKVKNNDDLRDFSHFDDIIEDNKKTDDKQNKTNLYNEVFDHRENIFETEILYEVSFLGFLEKFKNFLVEKDSQHELNNILYKSKIIFKDLENIKILDYIKEEQEKEITEIDLKIKDCENKIQVSQSASLLYKNFMKKILKTGSCDLCKRSFTGNSQSDCVKRIDFILDKIPERKEEAEKVLDDLKKIKQNVVDKNKKIVEKNMRIHSIKTFIEEVEKKMKGYKLFNFLNNIFKNSYNTEIFDDDIEKDGYSNRNLLLLRDNQNNIDTNIETNSQNKLNNNKFLNNPNDDQSSINKTNFYANNHLSELNDKNDTDNKNFISLFDKDNILLNILEQRKLENEQKLISNDNKFMNVNVRKVLNNLTFETFLKYLDKAISSFTTEYNNHCKIINIIEEITNKIKIKDIENRKIIVNDTKIHKISPVTLKTELKLLKEKLIIIKNEVNKINKAKIKIKAQKTKMEISELTKKLTQLENENNNLEVMVDDIESEIKPLKENQKKITEKIEVINNEIVTKEIENNHLIGELSRFKTLLKKNEDSKKEKFLKINKALINIKNSFIDYKEKKNDDNIIINKNFLKENIMKKGTESEHCINFKKDIAGNNENIKKHQKNINFYNYTIEDSIFLDNLKKINLIEEKSIPTAYQLVNDFYLELETLQEEAIKIRKEYNIKHENISYEKELVKTIEENIKRIEIEAKIKECEEEISRLDIKKINEMKELLSKKQKLKNELSTEMYMLIGEKNQIEKTLKNKNTDLEDYINTDHEYMKSYIENETIKLIKEDVETCLKSLEKRIIEYHSEKIDEINKILKDLWVETYTGNDIDYIKIKSETFEKKAYNYRIDMVKNGVEIELRGRCSAGQKVLACILIRLALCDVFSQNFPVLALDEPTTNLDRENVEALTETLVRLIKKRMDNKNFQLILITHDKKFVDMIDRECCETFYFIDRDRNGDSFIELKER